MKLFSYNEKAIHIYYRNFTQCKYQNKNFINSYIIYSYHPEKNIFSTFFYVNEYSSTSSSKMVKKGFHYLDLPKFKQAHFLLTLFCVYYYKQCPVTIVMHIIINDWLLRPTNEKLLVTQFWQWYLKFIYFFFPTVQQGGQVILTCIHYNGTLNLVRTDFWLNVSTEVNIILAFIFFNLIAYNLIAWIFWPSIGRENI